jgi:hypothetical protein
MEPLAGFLDKGSAFSYLKGNEEVHQEIRFKKTAIGKPFA